MVEYKITKVFDINSRWLYQSCGYFIIYVVFTENKENLLKSTRKKVFYFNKLKNVAI